jgi:uncharacterized repeat protein (TIGR03803 family)
MNCGTHESPIFKVLSAAAVLFLSLAICANAENDHKYRVLHNFEGGASDGANPAGSFVQSGSALYGMTQWGGPANKGTVFRINTDGTSFGLMHSFGYASSGQRPFGSLVLSGTDLFGMAGCVGNTSVRGAIFRISTDGTGFQAIRSFSGADGKWPYGDVIQSGSVLYGMNTYGGNNAGSGWVGLGTVFRVNTDGNDFQVLHTFAGVPTDGGGPHGSLIQLGSALYGMTMVGGPTNDIGTIFKINTDGTEYQRLHDFTGAANDGAVPYLASLTNSGQTLYGMTYGGGSGNTGTVFKMDADGSGFQVLHSFVGGHDGLSPNGSLIVSGSVLYGMTESGGTAGKGVVFRMNVDGTGYEIMHTFTGGASDGASPLGSLFLSDNTLYGMTSEGGSQNQGVIFALDVPEPKTAVLLGPGLLLLRRRF